MKINKGLFTDSVEKDQPEGSYRFAKNVIDSNVNGVLENEDGFTNLDEVSPYTVIGIIPVRKDFVVFSTDNTNSEIGLVVRTGSTLNYTTVYSDPDLNFNTDSPIKGEFRTDINNERIVAWIDDRNPPRVINIDNPAGIDDITDLDIFPNLSNPALTSPVINDTGGVLKTGALIPITAYETPDGSVTNWFVHDFTFYINDDSKSVAFNQNDGAAPGTISNKSVTFTLTGADTQFPRLVVGYIQIVDNIVNAYRITGEYTNNSTVTITITGNESTSDVTLDEILTPNALYNNAKAITQLSGRLFLGNLQGTELPELQSVALDIQVDYVSSLVNVIQNTNNHKDVTPPTFMPGEVYAFYLGVELKKGGWAFYHIPGRPFTIADRIEVTSEGMTYPRFQVEDTVNVPGAYSNMGYWENSNELYPDDSTFVGAVAGDLRGLPVRHHRFPTVGYLANVVYSGNSAVGITTLPRLGVNVSNVNIPVEIQSQISRWKIFFAKKSSQDSLVVGSDLLQFSASATDDTSVRWSTGGNWRTEFEQDGVNKDMPEIHTDTLRGHSLDMYFEGGVNTPTYANFAYKLRRVNLNEPYTGFRSVGGTLTIAGQYNYGFAFNESYVASAVVDFTVPSQTTRSGSSFKKRLDNFRYVPENALDDTIKTQYAEGVFAATINNPGTSFNGVEITRLQLAAQNVGAPTEQFKEFDGSDDPDNGKEDTMYIQYYKLLSSVHNSFTTQELVPTREYAAPDDTSLINVYGGDSFICYMSYLSAGPRSSTTTGATGLTPSTGIRMWKAYIGYSRRNWNYRYQEPGNIASFYHGKTDVRTLFSVTVEDGPFVETDIDITSLVRTDEAQNNVVYTEDYNRLNNFIAGVIVSPDLALETEFPNTIIYSLPQNEESQEYSWRIFRTEDRTVVGRNRGPITNLQGFRNRELLIHTEDSLFRTRTDARMLAESENIFLKSADIFDLPPEELVPTGYGGTQHKFACLLTKVGYLFPDDKMGKVFLYNGESLDEISSNGMRNFFRDFMGVATDNPFTSSGYTSGYDERNNRLLISKKNGDTSWTISYNPFKRTWTSYHDYVPDYMFVTADGSLYSLNTNVFYLNNSAPETTQKGQFYGDTVYPAMVDIVFNPEPTENKQFAALSWVSECYPVGMVDGQYSTNYDYNSTCTHITLRSPDHCTGRIDLARYSELDSFYSTNIRNITRSWYFDEIRDFVITPGFLLGFYSNYTIDPTKLNTNMEWYDQRKFTDKYVVCRFEFDNVINNRFLFLESEILYRYAR